MALSNWIRGHADVTPQKPAIIFENETISYQSLADQIDSYVQILAVELTVKPGDRVAYLGLNSPEFIALIFACARIGAIMLPLNWRLASPEHRQLLELAKPAALFVEDNFISGIETIKEPLESVALVSMANAQTGWLSMQDLEISSQHKASFIPDQSLSEKNGLLLCFTSGTTGTPKGALLSKKALSCNALNAIDMHDLTCEDTVLTLLPMFHVGGLNIQTLPALNVGATVVLLGRFDVDAFFYAFAQNPISLTLVVPTVMYALMSDPRWKQLQAKYLRMIAIGSSVVPESLVSAVCDWGVPLVQIYGATETCPIAAYTAATDAARKPASTGKTALHCEIKLVDEQGNEVTTGDKGEILVRGQNVLSEYWNQPQATRAAFSGDWFHTGDVGHFDGEGFLYVDGRIKEMIICGGENLYPAAIESVLSQNSDIEEVAIVGKPDDYWGEICVAVVVPTIDCSLDIDSIQNFCANKIARSSIPREVIIVNALPRNAMGKVVKEALADLLINQP